MTRDKFLKIRVTSDELEVIKNNATGASSVSDFIRDIALKRKMKKSGTAPELIRAINGYGNNLNQIARAINQNSGHLNPDTALDLLAKLEKIAKALDNLRSR